MVDRAGRIAACVAMLLLCQSVCAQLVVRWDGPNTGDWGDLNNWDPNIVPNNNGPDTFIAVIDAVGADYTVMLNIDVVVDGLELVSDNATLEGTGGTLEVFNSIQFRNAQLVGISPFGSLGTVVFDSTVCDDLCDILFSHAGSMVTWMGTGNIRLQGTSPAGTQFIHGEDSTFNILNAQSILADDTSFFQNEGTMLKSSLGPTTFEGGQLLNPGTLDVAAGTFETDAVALPGDTLPEGTWIVRDNAELAPSGSSATERRVRAACSRTRATPACSSTRQPT
jgi:hypothetical protein